MSDEYVLYYWPLAGRGEFIRLIFEEVGQPYKEVNDINDAMLDRKTFHVGHKGGFPNFAPPILKKGRHFRSIKTRY